MSVQHPQDTLIRIHRNVASTADGSAKFDQGESACLKEALQFAVHKRDVIVANTGKSAALATISGPMEAKLRDEQIDGATLDVTISGLQANDSK